MVPPFLNETVSLTLRVSFTVCIVNKILTVCLQKSYLLFSVFNI